MNESNTKLEEFFLTKSEEMRSRGIPYFEIQRPYGTNIKKDLEFLRNSFGSQGWYFHYYGVRDKPYGRKKIIGCKFLESFSLLEKLQPYFWHIAAVGAVIALILAVIF